MSQSRSKSHSRSRSRSRSRSKSQSKPRSVPINLKLYKKVVYEAKRKFKVWPSAYASGWVVHEYKRRGGRYSNSNSIGKVDSRLLRRWFDEKWIDVCQLPKIVPCGRQGLTYDNYEKNYPYCRPLKRVTSKTPRTARELSRAELKRRCQRKRKSPHEKTR